MRKMYVLDDQQGHHLISTVLCSECLTPRNIEIACTDGETATGQDLSEQAIHEKENGTWVCVICEYDPTQHV